MKILVVSSFLPFPLYSGGHIRLYNLLTELSKKHEITLVCEKRDYQTQEDIKEMQKICADVITVKRKKQWSWQNIIKTGISANPFLVVGHTNSDMKKRIKEVLEKETFDVIHVETFYIMQNLPKVNIPVVLAEHNLEYLVYKRYLEQKPFFIKYPLYLDIFKIKRLEEKFWQRANKLIAVSQDEKKLMKREDVVVIPNGVNTNQFKVQPFDFSSTSLTADAQGKSSKLKVKKDERRILFIGDFRWLQNRDSVEWILKEIWPQISSKFKVQSSKLSLKLWVVGRNIPESIKRLGDESVIFDENNQQSTPEIFAGADLLLAPVRAGGGTSYKILEAMASGVPVATTSLGIEGIEVKKSDSVLVSDSATELAERVVNILQNREEYERIAKNARETIEEKYDWKIIARKLEKVYESVVS